MTMGWFELVSLILNLLLGTGLIIQFITIRAIKSKATAEADSTTSQAGKDKIDLVNQTVTTMVETVNSLMAQNKELIDRYTEKADETERLRDEKKEMENKINNLEKRVNRMIQTNLKVIKVLENMGVDEEVIQPLREGEIT